MDKIEKATKYAASHENTKSYPFFLFLEYRLEDLLNLYGVYQKRKRIVHFIVHALGSIAQWKQFALFVRFSSFVYENSLCSKQQKYH